MSNNSLVGTIRVSRMPYYDNITNSIKYKARPVLIIKAERESGSCDFTVLPVSSITHKQNIDKEFDLELNSTEYPLLCLSKPISYVRCNKLMTVHSSTLAVKEISNLKESYPALWITIIAKVKVFAFKIH